MTYDEAKAHLKDRDTEADKAQKAFFKLVTESGLATELSTAIYNAGNLFAETSGKALLAAEYCNMLQIAKLEGFPASLDYIDGVIRKDTEPL